MKNENKNLTIEELTKACADAKETFDALAQQLNKAKKEEEEKEKAKLAIEQVARKKAVDEAFDNYKALLSTYVKDYGSYYTTRKDSSLFPELWHSFF